MKTVVKGKTYDTVTATKVALYDYKDDDGSDVEATLFQAPSGTFFVCHVWFDKDERLKHLVTVLGDDDLAQLIKTADSLTIINDEALGKHLPPEDGVDFIEQLIPPRPDDEGEFIAMTADDEAYIAKSA